MASRGAKRVAQGDVNLLIDDFLKSADNLLTPEPEADYLFPTQSKNDRPFRTAPVPKENTTTGSKVAKYGPQPQPSTSKVTEAENHTHSNTPTLSPSDESESEEIIQRGPYADSKMRLGRDYQAVPSVLVGRPGSRCQSPDRALCVWTPVPDSATPNAPLPVTDAQVASFVDLARERFGYTTEQALGMLYWHKYSVELSTADLPNFIPYPDEWTQEEKLVFDQAFSFQGKQFHKIIHALPDKTVPHLVKYYYQWKKNRAKTSLMDRRGQRGDLSDSECSDGELPELKPGGRRVRRPQRQQQQQQQSQQPAKDKQQQQRRDDKQEQQQTQQQYKRKLPRGIFLDFDALLAMSKESESHAAALLGTLDGKLTAARSRVQRNRSELTQRWEALLTQIQAYQEPDAEGQISYKWTDEELLLAVQGVRRYGKDFRAIAQLIGSKTENHVRFFFSQYRSKFGLDSVLAEYQKEAGSAQGVGN